MFVCLYSFTVKAFFVCNNVLDILESTDQRSCVVSIMLDASAKFLHAASTNWRENDVYIGNLRKDDMY